MNYRILIVVLAVLVGLMAGAMITTSLQGPSRTLVEPIELTPAPSDAKDEGDRSGPKKPKRRPGPEKQPAPVPPPPPLPADDGAAPVPLPPPGPAGDDDDDDADDDADDDGDDDGGTDE